MDKTYIIAGLKHDFKAFFIYFSPCLHEGVPLSCPRNAALFPVLQKDPMRISIAFFGNAFSKPNIKLVQFCMKT